MRALHAIGRGPVRRPVLSHSLTPMSKKKSGGEANSAEPRSQKQSTAPSYSKPVTERVAEGVITVRSDLGFTRDGMTYASKVPAQDGRLSFAARGLLLCMISLGGRVTLSQLEAGATQGQLAALLQELEACGYVTTSQGAQ